MNTIKTKLLNLHNISMELSLDLIKEMSKSKGLDVVVTPNIDHLVRLCNESSDSILSRVYHTASLCLCDSKIFEKLLRLKGKVVEEVIPGSSLTRLLFDKVISTSDKVLIIGGNEEMIIKLRSSYNNLSISHYNPPMGFINYPNEIDKTIDFAMLENANYLFLAVGSPRQEILAAHLKKSVISKGVALCIGASILFIVGKEKRAPLWLQKLHCEWLYRMLQEPKRLVGRYANNFIKLPKVFMKL